MSLLPDRIVPNPTALKPNVVGAIVMDALKTFDPMNWLADIEDVNNLDTVARLWLGATADYPAAILRKAATFKDYTPLQIATESRATAMSYAYKLAQNYSRVGIMRKLWPATANAINQRYKFEDSISGFDSFTSAALAIRDQYMINAKAHRYWNAYFTPELPSSSNMFIMEKKGLATKADVIKVMQEFDGLPLEWAEKVYTHMDYDPGFMEMARMSDVMPLSASWIDKKLEALGPNAEDKTVMKTYLQKRSIRDEMARMWSSVVSTYAFGLFTPAEMTALFTSWDLSTAEKDLRQNTLDMERGKTLLRLKRDTKVYLFRKGIITDLTLYNDLIDLKINDEVVNAMVALEDAKKGVIWVEP